MTHNLPEPPSFPWKCQGCQDWAVTQTEIEYYIETRQNNRLCSVFIPALEILKCGRCGELLFTEQVDAQVNEALRKHLEGVMKLEDMGLEEHKQAVIELFKSGEATEEATEEAWDQMATLVLERFDDLVYNVDVSAISDLVSGRLE